MPELLEAVAEQLASLVPEETEVLAALELGGVPVAVALSPVTLLPAALVRKAPNTRLGRGAGASNRRVLLEPSGTPWRSNAHYLGQEEKLVAQIDSTERTHSPNAGAATDVAETLAPFQAFREVFGRLKPREGR